MISGSSIRLLLGAFLILFALIGQAQNTKGDKPAAAPSSSKEKKGKLFGKKSSGPRLKSNRGQRARNVFPQKGPYVNNPSKKPKKEKASTIRMPRAVSTSAPSGRDRAWTNGTASGGRLQPRSLAGRIKNVYPQRGPYVNNPSPTPGRQKPAAARLPGTRKPVKQPSAKASNRNVYSQRGPFVNNPSRVAKIPGTNPKNRPLSKSRKLSISKAATQARSMGIRGAGFVSITSQFLTRGKKNVYWGKIRKKEKAVTTDISGRQLRRRNYHSPKVGLVGRDTLPFFRRNPRSVKRVASVGGGYQSATRTGRAWIGDISGSKLRSRPPGRGGQTGLPGKEIRSATRTGRASLSPITGKAPGLGAKAFANFAKPQRGKKGLRGFGGSASGKSWNNRNKPLQKKGATMMAMQTSRFTGPAKARRTAKGGGSVSGKLWNNRNQAIATKPPGFGSLRAGLFQGHVKSRRPEHGGGSVSGQPRDNRGQPIAAKLPGIGSRRAGAFQGNMKSRRPEHGGGSVSSQPRDNRGQPIAAKLPGLGSRRAGAFQGNIKSRRPQHGGGSVSGKLWNNKNQPVDVNTAGPGTIQASKFKGRTKGIIGGPKLSTLGQNFTGTIKAKRPQKGGGSVSGKLWNNKNQPIDVNEAGQGTVRGATFKGKMRYQKPEQTAGKPAKYQGDIKGFTIGPKMSSLGLEYEGDYKRKKKGIDNKATSFISKVFKRDKPGMLPATHIGRDERVATHAQRGKRSIFNRYVQNPKAADASLKKDRHPDGLMLNIPILNQTKRSVNAGHYVHAMKQYWNYTRNPNSNKAALLVREPGKVQAKIANLQGNVKMRKYADHTLHPDAKFAHSYRDNVKEERTIFMNIKLTWAKLFKKSDNQPRGLKQKPGKARYDPGEKGLWYD